MPESILLLTIIAAIGAACFYAGWRSAHAYLEAARGISEVTAAAVGQSREYASALDRTASESALLTKAVERNTEVTDARYRAVEESILTLFAGFERAGIVRGAPSRVARQVGEEAGP